MQAGSLSVAPSSTGTSRAGKGRKRKLSESSGNSGDSSDCDSYSDDPFVDKKQRFRVDSDKEEYIDKVETEHGKLFRVSKKAQLISGPLFKAWSLADDKDDKETVKYIKKAVLGLGQLQVSLNHERRVLSYGELVKDL